MKETQVLQIAVASAVGACSFFIAIALVYVGDLGPPAYALADNSEAIATAEISAIRLAAEPGVEVVVRPGL